MEYDVLVIAGTTEAREVIEARLKQNPSERILASTATELGREMLVEYPIDVHVGRLDLDGFTQLLGAHPCGQIIDASHPFAQIVSETVRQAAKECAVPYVRYEREHLAYDYEGIVRVRDVDEAIDALNRLEGKVLLTTGVNTAAAYRACVRDADRRLYIRVLDNAASLEGCARAGYAPDHVFGQMPPFSVEDNVALLIKTGAEILVSKDSGRTGGVDKKVGACRQLGIKMLLIARPQ